MAFTRITALWSGWPGAPGYSHFMFLGGDNAPTADSDASAVRALFAGITEYLPDSITIQVQSQAESYDDDMTLIGYINLDPVPPSVNGIASGAYSGGSGAVVNWGTAGVVGGRRIRGRTFLVPLAGAAYDADGSLSSVAISAIVDSAGALLSNGAFVIVGSHPGVVEYSTVETANVPDLAAVLRSRRT